MLEWTPVFGVRERSCRFRHDHRHVSGHFTRSGTLSPPYTSGLNISFVPLRILKNHPQGVALRLLGTRTWSSFYPNSPILEGLNLLLAPTADTGREAIQT